MISQFFLCLKELKKLSSAAHERSNFCPVKCHGRFFEDTLGAISTSMWKQIGNSVKCTKLFPVVKIDETFEIQIGWYPFYNRGKDEVFLLILYFCVECPVQEKIVNKCIAFNFFPNFSNELRFICSDMSFISITQLMKSNTL